ncbi:hypothetical protein C1T17_20795 (plasmid) [Sphingobium sp. SCG-1]|uniref:hypothetical protein n=1 Tax=Sphingobium sp. SCG-1 TaxID=2072936 RepID=UPI000CD6C2E8|nr:hypothetical protein [Sphingobium sp. SCG-1]AUW60478.1 hypothetical protein C1T17_19725 [Sphingobium sp. SCG-1]AUW60643.1 hypothetical protein C1T17_20795 [Sphingobium sp. SCG-1]
MDEFLFDTAEALDLALGEQHVVEEGLKTSIGEQRVEELIEYWEADFDANIAAAFLESSTYRERLLLTTWNRLARLHEFRSKVGREFMKLNTVSADAQRTNDT